MKIGVIGLGYLGKIHVKCLKQTDFDLVGVYDLDEHRTSSIAEEFNIKPFDSLDKAIKSCDALSIVTDTAAHFEIAKAAIESKVHVFVEKPLTSTLEAVSYTHLTLPTICSV